MSAPSSYLRYLPAVYSTTQPAFLAQYLKIFEKILTGIGDAELGRRKGIHELLQADVIGNLFYPRLSFLFPPSDTRFIPPISGATAKQEAAILADLDTYIQVPAPGDPLAGYVAAAPGAADPNAPIEAWLNDFLAWLGGWVALAVDNDWDIDQKRTVIAEIMALYRMRGTLQGLSMLANLLLGLPMAMHGQQLDDSGKWVTIDGVLSVSISAPAAPDIVASDLAGSTFIVRDTYASGAPVVAGYLPWLFNVQMVLPNAHNPLFILTASNVAQIQALYGRLEQFLRVMKPAASNYLITIVPSMQLQAEGYATALGVNTLLGQQGIKT